MKNALILCVALITRVALAGIDQPETSDLRGISYHAGGWFSYKTEANENEGVKFNAKEQYVLAPHYAQPIRKIVLNLQASVETPGRYLKIVPFVNGVETADDALICSVVSVKEAGRSEFVTLDYSLQDRVDSFWIKMDGSGSSGVWTIKGIVVCFGERTAEEDDLLKQFASQLPSPQNLHLTDYTTNSLSLAADVVDGACGYQFEINRLVGTPLTVLQEGFASELQELSEGWTFLTRQNAALDRYASSGYYDVTADDKFALQINCASKTGGVVRVEVLSPTCGEPISECSFLCKVGSVGKTDVFRVWGRREGSSFWMQLQEFVPVGVGKTNVVVQVAETQGVVQVKFEFEASDPNVFSTAAWDSLRVVYGGDEEAVPVEGLPDRFEDPACLLTDLTSCRYSFRVKTLGGRADDVDYRDSSWSDGQIVDLRWAGLEVAAPQVEISKVADNKLTIRWPAAIGVSSYLVTVFPSDDPDSPVVKDLEVTGTSVVVTVPVVGSYSAVVTAVSPCGQPLASSSAVSCEVEMGALGVVTAVAEDRTTIGATWKTLTLATGYLAKLFRVSGWAMTETVEYPDAPWDNVIWGEGWSTWGIYEKTRSGSVKIEYQNVYLTSRSYSEPVTHVTYSLVNNSSDSSVERTYVQLRVSSSTTGDDWRDYGGKRYTPVAETIDIPVSEGVRRVRFFFGVDGTPKSPNAEFGRVTIVSGEETAVEVRSQSVAQGAATFEGLDATARYRIRVVPQPSEDAAGAKDSETIDLAAEHFRRTGAIAVSTLKGGQCFEDFSALEDVVKDTTEIRKLNLDYWQFGKGSGATDKLLYCAAGTNKTAGGVYVYEETGEGAPRVLGTLSTGSMGYSFGIAFKNDLSYPVALRSLAFQAIQKSFRTRTSTYALEWLMTEGATDIATEGAWTKITMPETAPYTAETRDGREDFRQDIVLTEELPPKIPVGDVLILRWRQAKVASGPMMAIDDVTVDFEVEKKGLSFIVH